MALKMRRVPGGIVRSCIIALRTGILPRWIAFSGFACGLVLLLVISNWLWIAMLFPLWTIFVSVHILAVQRKRSDTHRAL